MLGWEVGEEFHPLTRDICNVNGQLLFVPTAVSAV